MNSWKIVINIFFQKFIISGKSPAAKNIFFAKIFFSKCISSGVFQDLSKILKGTVRGQLTLTKLVSGITKIFFSVPPAVKMWKHAVWFDILIKPKLVTSILNQKYQIFMYKRANSIMAFNIKYSFPLFEAGKPKRVTRKFNLVIA